MTAFGPFDGGPNCSQAALDALRARKDELDDIWRGAVAFERFEVDTEAIAAALVRAVGQARPSHVLMMGQASSRFGGWLERVACNARDLGVPDACGRTGALGPVTPHGPAERRADWPDLAGAADAMTAAGLPTFLSDDAGRHLCNQTLYLALEAAERARRPFVATFLHLPLTAELIAAQIPAARGAPLSPPPPTLDHVVRAILAFLGHTRRQA